MTEKPWREYETLFNGAGDDRIERVLAITAHPGDLRGRALLALRRLKLEGTETSLVVVTSEAEDEPETEEERAAVEARERSEAADAGVHEVVFLGHAAFELRAADRLSQELVGAIRQSRPDVVMTFDPIPAHLQHPDHRVLGRLVLDAAWLLARAGRWWPETGEPHTVKEAWLFDAPAPDLFIATDAGEEAFAQIDLRGRYRR